jgi:hypothetical protein
MEDIVLKIGIYSNEQIIDVVKKVETLLDKTINTLDSIAVREYISALSAYRGRLVAIESQIYRELVEKRKRAIDDNVMTGKSSELRDIQLDDYTKVDKSNFDLIRKYREELTAKTTLCSSMLKSIDLHSTRGTREYQ